MRLARYLALEVGFLLAALGLGGAGLVRGAALLAARAPGPGISSRRDVPAPRAEAGVPGDPAIASEIAGTFLGMADELLLARVREQPVVATKLNKGGSSISFRLELGDGSRAAFKPVQTNLQTIPRKEVAAYRIGRLLGLNAVPPAAPRTLSRQELLANLHPDSQPMLPRVLAETLFDGGGRTAGMVQYWIPRIVDSPLDSPEGMARGLGWLTLGSELSPEDRGMAAQLSSLLVFDFVTDNPDRYSGGNLKMSPDGRTLYYMDNTMAFFLNPEGHEVNRRPLLRAQRFSRAVYRALAGLTAPAIRAALADSGAPPESILTGPEIQAVVARRAFVQRHIQGLIAQHGEDDVLCFP